MSRLKIPTIESENRFSHLLMVANLKKTTTKEVSKKRKVSESAVSQVLNKLQRDGYLIMHVQGKNHIYRVNYEKICKEMIEILQKRIELYINQTISQSEKHIKLIQDNSKRISPKKDAEFICEAVQHQRAFIDNQNRTRELLIRIAKKASNPSETLLRWVEYYLSYEVKESSRQTIQSLYDAFLKGIPDFTEQLRDHLNKIDPSKSSSSLLLITNYLRASESQRNEVGIALIMSNQGISNVNHYDLDSLHRLVFPRFSLRNQESIPNNVLRILKDSAS